VVSIAAFQADGRRNNFPFVLLREQLMYINPEIMGFSSRYSCRFFLSRVNKNHKQTNVN